MSYQAMKPRETKLRGFAIIFKIELLKLPAPHILFRSYNDDDHLLLNSDRRADAVVLEALIADQPANDLIPKIVRGLLAHRTQGRWSSTQENVFVLLALDRYFKTYEKVTPDFVARVWLG